MEDHPPAVARFLGRGLLGQDWNLRARGRSEDRGGVKYVHLLRVADGSGDTRRCPRLAMLERLPVSV